MEIIIPNYKNLGNKIEFHGVQEAQQKEYYLFSDKKTGSSFLISSDEKNLGQAIYEKLEVMRKAFGK